MFEDLLRRFAERLSFTGPVNFRPYQVQAMALLERALDERRGLYVLRQSRQSGKNEVCAALHRQALCMSGEYLAFAPTYAQTTIAQRRLDRYIRSFKMRVRRTDGHIYEHGASTLTFLTASPTANILGYTASTGITLDEAQEVDRDVFEQRILPMTASTNAPIIMVGTAAYGNDILYQTLQYLREHAPDHILEIPAEMVAEACPEYATHYQAVIDRYGKDSIMVKTQYRLLDVTAGGGLLTEEQVRLIRGTHQPQLKALPHRTYIISIDVGGASDDPNPKNDCTVAITSELLPGATPYDPPEVHVVRIDRWQGAKWEEQERDLCGLISAYNPIAAIIDARGIGEMLSEYLSRRSPTVVPYKASAKTVDEDIHRTLGYINRGLLKLYQPNELTQLEFNEMILQASRAGYKVSAGGINLEKAGTKIDALKALTYIPRAIEHSGLFRTFDTGGTGSPI